MRSGVNAYNRCLSYYTDLHLCTFLSYTLRAPSPIPAQGYKLQAKFLTWIFFLSCFYNENTCGGCTYKWSGTAHTARFKMNHYFLTDCKNIDGTCHYNLFVEKYRIILSVPVTL